MLSSSIIQTGAPAPASRLPFGLRRSGGARQVLLSTDKSGIKLGDMFELAGQFSGAARLDRVKSKAAEPGGRTVPGLRAGKPGNGSSSSHLQAARQAQLGRCCTGLISVGLGYTCRFRTAQRPTSRCCHPADMEAVFAALRWWF
jgi:hypothetical protein